MSAEKELTYSDVSEHTGKKDLYIVVHDKVYNCSSFVDEHPYVHPPASLFLSATSQQTCAGLPHPTPPHSCYTRVCCVPRQCNNKCWSEAMCDAR